MAKLTDTQLIILSKAVLRDDAVAAVPDGMTKAAAAKVGSSLVARKLMREILAKPGMPVWRVDKNGRPMSLIILRAGRDAIGSEEVGTGAEPLPPNKPNTAKPAKASKSIHVKPEATKDKQVANASNREGAVAAPRAGSKQAMVIEMLSATSGVTIDGLVNATGWLPHTTRAALTGLRKKGFGIERQAREGERSSTYRIVSAANGGA